MSPYDHLLTACVKTILDYLATVSSPHATSFPPLEYEELPGDTLATQLTERIESLNPETTDKKPFLLYITYIIARCWPSRNEMWSDTTYTEIHALFSNYLHHIATLMQQSNKTSLTITYAGTSIDVSGFLNGWVLGSTSKSRLGTIIQNHLENLEKNHFLTLIETLQKKPQNIPMIIDNILRMHQYPMVKAAYTTSQIEVEKLQSAHQTTIGQQDSITAERDRLASENQRLSSENRDLSTQLSTAPSWGDLSSGFFRRMRIDLTEQSPDSSTSMTDTFNATTEGMLMK